MAEYLDRQLGYTEPKDRPTIFDADGGAAYTARGAAFFRGEGAYELGRSQAVMLKAGFEIPRGVTLSRREIDATLDQGTGLYRMSDVVRVADADRLDNSGRIERVIFVPIQIC